MQQKYKLKKLGTLLALIMTLITITAPVSAFSSTLPSPGDRLKDKANWATTELVRVSYDMVEIVIHDSLTMLSEIDRYEIAIYGDILQFHGESVLIYENGHKVYPIHEVFADGERLTFYVDHTQGLMAERFVSMQVVKGAKDTTLYSVAILHNGNQGNGLATALGFLAVAAEDSPYRLTRQTTRAGTLMDVLVFSPTSVIPTSSVPVARSNAAVIKPTDEQLSAWAVNQVNQAIAARLVPEHLQAKYREAITRAEFCALAVALYENVAGEITGRMIFADTTDVNVQKMAAIGVVAGVGENRFAPNNTLTREQAAVVLARLANAVKQPIPEFPATFEDYDSISSWARVGVGQVQFAGIMSGVGDNRFAPQDHYTREQSIITILRLFEMVKN